MFHRQYTFKLIEIVMCCNPILVLFPPKHNIGVKRVSQRGISHLLVGPISHITPFSRVHLPLPTNTTLFLTPTYHHYFGPTSHFLPYSLRCTLPFLLRLDIQRLSIRILQKQLCGIMCKKPTIKMNNTRLTLRAFKLCCVSKTIKNKL